MTTKIRIKSIPTRTRKAWAIVAPEGHILLDSIDSYRCDAIEKIAQSYGESWKQLKKQGYRSELITLSKS